MIYLFIYLLGFNLTYKVIKDWRDYRGFNNWGDVVCTIGISLLSFFGLIIVLIGIGLYFIHKYKDSKKPPKWL